MCRKAGEMGVIPTPLNPEAKPWQPTANPAPIMACKKLVNCYYPYYHYPVGAGFMYQYPPSPPTAVHYHNYHVPAQKKPQQAVSRYNVQHQPYKPDRETTQKGYPRGRGKWVVGGEWKEVVTYHCTGAPSSPGFSKAKSSGYMGMRSVGENGRGHYVPKKMTDHSINGGDAQVVSAATAPAVVYDDDAGGGQRTTVMIRNIPNKIRRGMLLCFLDKYCLELNLEYDFVYLPMDFRTLDNFGYAFVNFTCASAATKIRNALSNYKWGLVPSWEGTLVECKKICQVTWAKIQGKEDLARRFVNTFFDCDSCDFLPAVLNPPRNGSNSNSVTVTPVGKCRKLLLA